jgi:hypothetical protein
LKIKCHHAKMAKIALINIAYIITVKVRHFNRLKQKYILSKIDGGDNSYN